MNWGSKNTLPLSNTDHSPARKYAFFYAQFAARQLERLFSANAFQVQDLRNVMEPLSREWVEGPQRGCNGCTVDERAPCRYVCFDCPVYWSPGEQLNRRDLVKDITEEKWCNSIFYYWVASHCCIYSYCLICELFSCSWWRKERKKNILIFYIKY